MKGQKSFKTLVGLARGVLRDLGRHHDGIPYEPGKQSEIAALQKSKNFILISPRKGKSIWQDGNEKGK